MNEIALSLKASLSCSQQVLAYRKYRSFAVRSFTLVSLRSNMRSISCAKNISLVEVVRSLNVLDIVCYIQEAYRSLNMPQHDSPCHKLASSQEVYLPSLIWSVQRPSLAQNSFTHLKVSSFTQIYPKVYSSFTTFSRSVTGRLVCLRLKESSSEFTRSTRSPKH